MKAPAGAFVLISIKFHMPTCIFLTQRVEKRKMVANKEGSSIPLVVKHYIGRLT